MNTLMQSHKQHQNWLKALDVIHELNEVCQYVRSHRGTSTAQIEGDTFFADITQSTSTKISEMFVELDDKAELFFVFETHETFFEVIQQWLTIQLHWNKQAALDNFEQHSALLASIHQLMWCFSDVYIKQQNHQCDKILVTHFFLNTHISCMEAIAKLRGMACFYSAKQYLSSDDKRSLRDEIKNSYVIWSDRSKELGSLPVPVQQRLSQTTHANLLNKFMADFIQLLENAFKKQQNMPNGSEIFNAGSTILSVMNMQFDTGLDELRSYLPDELNHWVHNSCGESASTHISR
ncbi:MAG: hypothetical protein HRU20_01615 [Pseudomonadales bacterium]|nr:hypothetical protein [Pseudomonadales bacterium]